MDLINFNTKQAINMALIPKSAVLSSTATKQWYQLYLST